MTSRRSSHLLVWLGGLLLVYLAYPVGAFLFRVIGGHNEGWNVPGLWSALRVSVVGATVSLLIGVLAGIPLAYVLARRRGWLGSVLGVVVQLPLAVPPLISGILLIYIVGPYTFLGQLSGERLTQTMYGVVISQSFVSLPFLVVVARSAFAAIDPSLDDVAATLGHGPLARFLRVDVPAAADGIRAGMVLMWLRAFGEYGTTVVLAYHPYTLPVYVDNLFTSSPLSQAEAPTILAFGVAVAAVGIGRVRRPRRTSRRAPPTPSAPRPTPPTPVGFAIDATVGTFRLQVRHPEGSQRLAVVGPSGSGKTITLRVLAGLLGPDAGTVTYGGVDVSRIAPERRRIGYVPQGLDLNPGRNVWQQTVFGVHADPGLAAWWLHTLHLDGLLDRYPDQLSGGQRQRVSLARALACGPDVVLLDEPFSALDAPVRNELRRELRRLQHQTGLSTILVTHDPEEAAILADEIMVIAEGQVLQSGRVSEVYRRPVSPEVARLLGVGDILRGVMAADGTVRSGRVNLAVTQPLPTGTDVLWSVPPERVHVSPLPAASAAAPSPSLAPGGESAHLAVVSDVLDLGSSVELVLRLAGGPELRSRTGSPVSVELGASFLVSLEREAVMVWAASADVADQ